MLDLKKHSVSEIYSLFFQNIFQCKISKDLCLGVFYMTIHIVYIIVIIYNLFFMHNLIYTFILLVIIYMNFLTVFLLRTCPIVLFEKHYINTTCLKTIFFSGKYENEKNKDNKNKDKKDKKKKKVLSTYLDYGLDEFTLQGLITVGLIVAIKILILSVF
jgi:hypothetical protein